MLTYPMHFKVGAKMTAGIQATWTTSAAAVPGEIKMAIPPEFNGPGGGYSPEDLYALALTNCFFATFKVFAEKSALTYSELHAQLDLEVDRDEKGFPWMARANMSVHLMGSNDREKALRVLEKTAKGCLILNSVKTEKHFTYEIH